MSMSAIAREVGLEKPGVQYALRVIKGEGYRGKVDPDYLVYWHWDANGVLLYIGYTEDMGAREKQHSREDDWYTEVVATKRTRYGSEAEARAAETEAIREEQPKYNVMHNSSQAA